MPRYEYKVVPAPTKGLKGKGVKGPEARFSHAVQELMNGLSGYGWEYQRAETLPSTERSGLTGSTTEWRNVLVFRRPRENDADAFAPELLPAPDAVQPAQAPEAEKPAEKAPEVAPETADSQDTPKGEQQWDNGVEDTEDAGDLSGPVSMLAKARKSTKSDA